MVTITTYRDWQVGDIINICASIDEYCGTYNQFIFVYDINVTKSPDACGLAFGHEGGCGLHLNNVELTFKLVKISGSVEGKSCAPQQVYKTIGSIRTNSDGVAGLTYTVGEEDRLDYENAKNTGYPYKVIACITDADGQATINTQISIVTNDITIMPSLMKYKCTGAPNYQCIQATDGIYNTLAECQTACIVPGAGNISFGSDPQGAEIWLSPSPLGTPVYTGSKTPFTIPNLTVGTYNYILKRFNYNDYIGTVDVVANTTTSILVSMEPVPDAVYQFTIGLDSKTTANYVISTIDKFTYLLNSWILTKLSGVILSSVVYDEAYHQIVFEIENAPTLSLENDQQIKSLIIPVLVIFAIMGWIVFITTIVGLIYKSIWGGPKTVTPTHSSLQITTRMLLNEVLGVPYKDVTVEVAGKTLIANATNTYTVTFTDLEIGKTYPVKAYIPLSTDSKVNEAYFEGTRTMADGMNIMYVDLKIDTLQQRDWKLCNLKLDGNAMPEGTIIRVFRMKTLADGTPVLDTLGTTTSGADHCSGIVKVPAYLSDSQILTQFISNKVDPTQPTPTPQPGDKTDIPTIEKEKNIITVITQTILNNNIVADKIEIKDKATGTIVKSVIPSIYTTTITEIPKGTYTISVIKSGYKLSGCSLVPCEVEFTTDYLGSVSVTIVLESLVKTCKLDITVLDTYNKPPKTETYISIDGGAEKIAPAGILSIPEITAGDHKFTVRAEGYKDNIKDVTKTISCETTVEALVFVLEQTKDIVTGSMIMTVNDQKGSVKVDKNKSFTVKVTGGDATKDILIYNITEFPDLLVATIPAGQTNTTLSFDKDTNLELQAFQGCILGICSTNSNVVALTVGTGSPTCLIPGPFGTCIMGTGTAQTILIVGGLIIGGYVVYKVIQTLPKRKKEVVEEVPVKPVPYQPYPYPYPIYPSPVQTK